MAELGHVGSRPQISADVLMCAMNEKSGTNPNCKRHLTGGVSDDLRFGVYSALCL